MNNFIIIIIAVLLGTIVTLICILRENSERDQRLIRKFEYDLMKTQVERDKLKTSVDDLEKLVVIQKEDLPDGCTPGGYCGACLFANGLYIYEGHGAYQMYYHCTKAGSCMNFVDKGLD